MGGTEKDTPARRRGDDPMIMDADRDMREPGLFILGGDMGTGLAGVTQFSWSLREALNTLIGCLPSGVLSDCAIFSCLPQLDPVFFLVLGGGRGLSLVSRWLNRLFL